MATVPRQPGPAGSIANVLGELRRRIGRYVLIEGLALVLVAMGAIFWATLGVDWAWFGFRKLELPGWFRGAVLVIAVGVVIGVLVRHVLLRMFRDYGDKDLALVLERRFPELNDGLITAVEMGGTVTASETDATAAMLSRTVSKVSDNVRKLPMESVFAMKPLRMAVTGAVAMAISVGALGVANGQTLKRWWNAFVLQKDSYWDRETNLSVTAIVQPGDRVREFRMASGVWELLHPRNSDLTISIAASGIDGEESSLPDRVRLDLVRSADRKRVYLSPLADSQFRYSIDRLSDDLEFNIQGGDFANRLPFRVRVVDPPRIDAVTLQCDYPANTGWNESRPTEVNLTGAQVELPMESRFELIARTNKRLVGFHLEAGETELHFSEAEAVLATGSEDAGVVRRQLLSTQTTAGLLDSGATTIRLPLVVSGHEGESTADRIRIKPDSLLRFYLHDEDDILSAEPVVVRVMGTPDEPPLVDCERSGVGDAITRKASIPIGGLITDDYGVANARFEFKVDDGADWRPRRFRNRTTNRPLEFSLQGRDGEDAERFNVSTLDLQEGQKLTLSVYAEDADDIHGPNIGRSQKFEFKIVSNEELLSLLYAREINLRRRFEEVIRQVQEVRDDLMKNRSRLKGLASASGSEAGSVRTRITASASRALNTVRKNNNECRSVEAAFSDIVEELVNNAIPPRSISDEMRRAIVQPLHAINEQDFPAADTVLGSLKLAVERDAVTSQHFDESIVAIDRMLSRMRVLLDEIKELAELHEIVSDLKRLIDAQRDLLEKTKAQQKRKLFEDALGGDDE